MTGAAVGAIDPLKLAVLALASAAMLGLGTAHGQSPASAGRPMTVVDLVQLATFGSQPQGYAPADVDVPSPDGQLHAVLIKRGNVADNSNIFTLLLFRTKQLFGRPMPDTLLTFASSSNRPAIGSLRWLDDNRTMVFLGERIGELPQVYAFDTETRRLTQRTHHATEITHFDVAPPGSPVVYTAKAAVDTSAYATMRARGFAVRAGQFVGDVLSGAWAEGGASEWTASKLAQTFISRAGEQSPVLAKLPGGPYRECDANALSIEPTGRYALIRCKRGETPAGWRRYTDQYLAKLVAGGLVLPEFALLDLERGTVAPLVDAPVLGATVRWSPTGRSLVLGNAFLPLTGVDSGEARARAAHAALAEVSVPSGAIDLIAHRDTFDVVGWDARTNIVDFARGQYGFESADKARVRYRKTAAGWKEVNGGRVARSPRLVVEQGLNQALRMVAVERKRRSLVLDPNPQLAGIRLAHVELVRWRNRSGTELLGGLYYPTRFVKGERYPLVIQTHGFDPAAFAPDGVYPTANAAQPLAAAGIMVLQMRRAADGTWVSAKDLGTPPEAAGAIEEIESAIDHLDSLGIIDRSRVGISGFSRTCYHVLYLLTHSKLRIAAAALSDGVDYGYVQYLMFQNAVRAWGNVLNDFHTINGGPPWGESLDLWRQRSPGFNLDRVTAPVRFEAIGPTSTVLEEWEPYASLLLQQKPAELYVIPDGAHLLVKPWERLASSGGNYDWFRFWLQGEEDSDPAKADQYARWRELRKFQRRQTLGDTAGNKSQEGNASARPSPRTVTTPRRPRRCRTDPRTAPGSRRFRAAPRARARRVPLRDGPRVPGVGQAQQLGIGELRVRLGG